MWFIFLIIPFGLLFIWFATWWWSFSNQFRNQGLPAQNLSQKEIENWKKKGLSGSQAGQVYNNGWTDPTNPQITKGRIEFYTRYQQSDKNLDPVQVNRIYLDKFYKILWEISQDNNPNLDYGSQINQVREWYLPPWRTKQSLLEFQNSRLNSFLNQEQRKVLDLASQGKSIFYTGPAGSGKSFLLQRIIKQLELLERNVVVTAPTGIAAVNVGGTTIHSFSGIGTFGDDSLVEDLVKRISNQRSQVWVNNWRTTDTLIIDEISMLGGVVFDKLEYIARKIRRKHLPFGGLQLILTGDFFQLPPVKSKKLCFEAKKWNHVLSYTINLTKIYRQQDPKLVNLLNEIRFGEISSESRKVLYDLEKEPDFPNDGIKETKLVSTNDEKNAINDMELKKIDGKIHNFRAKDWEDGRYKGRLETLIKNLLVADNLELKIGCQAMLIKNLRDSSEELVLVNGSQGVVVGFDLKNYPIVKFANGIEKVIKEEEWTDETPLYKLKRASRTQIPLVLSWAITIHKSQGQSIERLTVDLSRVFERGQTYVALSRACLLKYLQVIGFSESKINCDERVKKFYRNLSSLEFP